MKPTHIVTIIEPVNMAEEAASYLKQKEKAKQDADKSVITLLIQKQTAEYLHGLIDKDFDDNLTEFDNLIRITEHSKDMGFDQQVGDFLKFIEENFPVQYQEYKDGKKSDHSGASDQDNR